MNYRMTKECGLWWSGNEGPGPDAWGLSEAQLKVAEKVAPGDILLHFIDRVHAWAGYSTVTGVVQENNRDSNADWRTALPYVIPIERRTWLAEGRCERTVKIADLECKHYHRRRTFHGIAQSDAERIIAAIESAARAELSVPSVEFQQRWRSDAEAYYGEIVIRQANGKCWLCGMDFSSWAAKVGMQPSEFQLKSSSCSFLDAAHIDPRCKKGRMTPDNLRALCPNCHRLADRLSDEQRENLLRPKD